MSKVIFTTCGTSAYSAGCWELDGVEPTSGKDAPANRVENEKITKEGEAKGLEEKQLVEQSKERIMQVWQDVDSRIGDLPAEVASLLALDEKLGEGGSEDGITKDDTVHLLHSEDGKYCAEVIRIMLKEIIFPGLKVHRQPFAGLDPGEPKRFSEGLREMWCYCLDHINLMMENKDNRYFFNLTGGYKPMVFTLSALCHSLRREYSPEIIYIHDHETIKEPFSIHFEEGGPAYGPPVAELLPVPKFRSDRGPASF